MHELIERLLAVLSCTVVVLRRTCRVVILRRGVVIINSRNLSSLSSSHCSGPCCECCVLYTFMCLFSGSLIYCSSSVLYSVKP